MPPDRGLIETRRILIQIRGLFSLLVLIIVRTAGEYAIEILHFLIGYNPSDRVFALDLVYIPPDMRASDKTP